ncbi:efflux RND transporter periplasmic adaptor subunit [Flavobacterium daemonense]|uniref:efflux RND transporter periplasmic adaptor subunit n=1 Tax=Flavobacterium daemonense TaxID=1393049 RepID=UPI00118507D8|nr:efflux RND transporter periplasmic adaptor subunit [Flavobacterium daemonense]KAF2336560.1 efflux RND transporter periplasmic adaptor subunit [Flavobacterium daemonense]
MNKVYTPAIFLLFLLLACKKEAPPQPKPLEIPIVQVLQQDVKLESEFTGQTYGQSDIQINPRVDGVIQSLNFKEGGLVTKGQLLYTIDPLPFQNKVTEAQGRLAEMQARLAKTKSDYEMMEPLAKMNAISQREYIGAKAAYSASKASIDAATASVKNAKIELSYCSITAPISGLIGISKVRVGDYVRPGPASVLNTVSDLGDVRVRFTMSEQEFLRIFREMSKKDSGLKNEAKSISILLSDGTPYSETGKISFADRQIDPATGAVTFEAAFANPQQLIRPGQYVKIHVVTDIHKNAIIIPQRSVIEMQGITQVYVVGANNKVEMKEVKLGPAFKDSYIITDGLTANDKIALGGTSQLKSGNVVTPQIKKWAPGEAIN